jgi:Leucine-rich repeat (LRR) protein
MGLYKLILFFLLLLLQSCDNDNNSNIAVFLNDCSSNGDNVQYSGLLYNCGDLEFLNDLVNINPSFSNLNLIDIGVQNWSYSGRLLDLILYESHNVNIIPSSIENLDALLVLDLSADAEYPGSLNILPYEIGDLASLVELYLNYNQLIVLPESIGNLSNLEELNVSNNQLASLPSSLENLSNLENLYINDNLLESIPESLCNLNVNCDVDIYNNFLCDSYYYSCFEDFFNFNWNWQNQEGCP